MSTYSLLIESAKSQYNEAKSNFYVLFGHMIKFKYQPYNQSKSWCGSILNSYNHIAKNLRTNKTALNMVTREDLEKSYQKAIDKIVKPETGLKDGQFPSSFPNDWDFIQLVNTNKYIKDFINSNGAVDLVDEWMKENGYKFY